MKRIYEVFFNSLILKISLNAVVISIIILNCSLVLALGASDSETPIGRRGISSNTGSASGVASSAVNAAQTTGQSAVDSFKSWWSEGDVALPQNLQVIPPACTSVAKAIQGPVQSCYNATKALHDRCRPLGNEYLQGIGAVAGVLGLSAASLNDTCKKMNSLLATAITGVTLYSTYCGVLLAQQMTTCAASRNTARTAIATAITADPVNKPTLVSCQELVLGKPGDKKSPATFVQLGQYNDRYTAYMASAAAGLVKLKLSQKSAKSCEGDTQVAKVDCVANPGDPSCSDWVDGINCSLPANAGAAVCICRKNPNQQGCQQKASIPTYSGSADSTYGVNNNDGISISNADVGSASLNPVIAEDVAIQGADSNGGGGGGSGFSGGGGGGASGKPGGGADTPRTGASGSRINTDIYSGYEGGSGYRVSGSNSGGPDNLGYGRGGARFGQKPNGVDLAARKPSALEAGITPPSGKSNFDKIGQRFIDLRGTFVEPGK